MATIGSVIHGDATATQRNSRPIFSAATSPSHGDRFYDAVNVTTGGVLDFNDSTLQLSFDSLDAVGSTFELFDAIDTAALAGNFGGVVVTGGFYTGLEWTKTGSGWTSSATGEGDSLVFDASTGTLTIMAAIPEPASVVLAAVGIVALACVRTPGHLTSRGRPRS